MENVMKKLLKTFLETEEYARKSLAKKISIVRVWGVNQVYYVKYKMWSKWKQEKTREPRNRCLGRKVGIRSARGQRIRYEFVKFEVILFLYLLPGSLLYFVFFLAWFVLSFSLTHWWCYLDKNCFWPILRSQGTSSIAYLHRVFHRFLLSLIGRTVHSSGTLPKYRD